MSNPLGADSTTETVLSAYTAIHNALVAKYSLASSTLSSGTTSTGNSTTSHLLHPLGPFTPLSSDESTRLLTTELSPIVNALQSFTELVNSVQSTSSVPDQTPVNAHQQLNKLLTLLREHAQSSAVTRSSVQQDEQLANRLLAARRTQFHYSTAKLRRLQRRNANTSDGDDGNTRQSPQDDEPVEFPSEEASAQSLEKIARQLGLVSFRDEEDTAMAHAADSNLPLKLSIGGQVVAIDFELPTAVTPSTSAMPAPIVRVSYALGQGGETKRLPRQASALAESLHFGPGRAGDWDIVRDRLQLLKRLDEACTTPDTSSMPAGQSDVQMDWFAAQEQLEATLQTRFSRQATPIDGPSALGPFSPRFSSSQGHAAFVVYSASPMARILGDTIPGDAEVYSASFALDFDSKSQTSDATGPRIVATLVPPVPILARTGQEVQKALAGELITPSGDEWTQSDMRYALPGTVFLEDLLLASDLTDPAYTVQRYNLDKVLGDGPDDETSALSFSLANPSQVPGLLCTHLRFSLDVAHSNTTEPWADRVARALEILTRQIAVNDLVRSAFDRRSTANDHGKAIAETLDVSTATQHVSSTSRPVTKKRRLDSRRDAAGLQTTTKPRALTLDDILGTVSPADEAVEADRSIMGTTHVYVHMIQSGTGGVGLSFASPPSQRQEGGTGGGEPCSVTLVPSSTGSGWKVNLAGKGFDWVTNEEGQSEGGQSRQAVENAISRAAQSGRLEIVVEAVLEILRQR